MNEMIKRCTKAAAEEINKQDIYCGDNGEGYAVSLDAFLVDGTVDLIAVCRAILKEMREPTHMMLVRGSDQLSKPPKTLPEAWRDMIDAALEE